MENNAVGRAATLINEEIGDTLAEEEVAEFRSKQEETSEFEDVLTDDTTITDNLIQVYPNEEGIVTPEVSETEIIEIKEDVIGVNTDAPIRDSVTEFDRINDTTNPVMSDLTDDIINDNPDSVTTIDTENKVTEEEVASVVTDKEETVPSVDTQVIIEDITTTNTEPPVNIIDYELINIIVDTNPIIEEPEVIEDIATITPAEETKETDTPEDVAIVKEEVIEDKELVDINEEDVIVDTEEIKLTGAQIKIHQLEAICTNSDINNTGEYNTPILKATLGVLQSIYSDQNAVKDVDDFELELLTSGENTEAIGKVTFMLKETPATQIIINKYGKLLYVGGLLDNIKNGITKQAFDFDNAIRSITGVPSLNNLYEPFLYFTEGESGVRYFNVVTDTNYTEYKKVIEDLTKEITNIGEVPTDVLPTVIIHDKEEYDKLVFNKTINIINPATGNSEDAEFLITKDVKPLDKITGREVSLTIEKLEPTINDDKVVVSNTYKSIIYHEFLVIQ